MSLAPLADVARRHRPQIAAAGALALVVAIALAASAYTDVREERRAQDVAPWSESARYEYAVPVTRNSTHLPIGTVLPMGEPAYFRTVSDEIRLDFAWDAAAPEAARGVAAARMVAQVRAQTTDGRPYWSIEHTLAEATAATLADGLTLQASLDLDALVEELQRVSRELPADGIVNWSVRTTVVYAVDIAGRHEQGESLYVLDIDADDPRFVLPTADALAWERPHTERHVVATATQAGWGGVLGSLHVLAPGALALVLLALAALVGAPGDAFAREHRRYRDWVSVAAVSDPVAGVSSGPRLPGIVPRNDAGAPVVDVATLEDLVHIASDARSRVLLDEGTRVFYALLPHATYRYAAHATP